MDSLYKNSILARLNEIVRSNGADLKFNTLLPEGAELVKLLATGNLSVLPIISISDEYDYIIGENVSAYTTTDSTDEIHSNTYDYSEVLPAKLHVSFTLIALDVSDIIEMEKLILNSFSDVQHLTAKHPKKSGEKLHFDICVDNSADIKRQNQNIKLPNLGNCTLYQSIIRLKCESCAIFLPELHPAQIELDRQIQIQLVKRGKALEELLKKQEVLQENNRERISLTCSGIIKLLGLESLNGYGFNELYEKMLKTKGSISDANQACIKDAANKKVQLEQEQAAIEAANKQYGKSGDKVLNVYTDAVVKDIRSKVADKLNIPVYGGSTYMEWFRLYYAKELKIPNILVTDFSSFTMYRNTYTVIDGDGDEKSRPCVKDKLPIEYNFAVGILAKTKEEAETYRKAITEAYSDELKLNIDISLLNGDVIPLTAQYDDSNPIAIENLNDSLFGNIYKSLLSFKKTSTVYCVKAYTKDDVQDNQRLQYRLLQQALFALECSEEVKHGAIYNLDRNYKALITKKGSIFGAFKSEDYKKLKVQFDNGTPIDRNLFNSALKNITQIFPSLYDRMIVGWTHQQIKEYMEGYVKYFEEQYNSLCDILDMPTSFTLLSYPSPRSRDSLRACIEFMGQPHYTLEKALLDFMTYEVNRQAQQAAEDEARREARRESGGGGFLSSMINQGLEKSNIKRNAGKRGKRDLIGQAGCAKTYGGSCSSCNIRFSCSRYFM